MKTDNDFTKIKMTIGVLDEMVPWLNKCVGNKSNVRGNFFSRWDALYGDQSWRDRVDELDWYYELKIYPKERHYHKCRVPVLAFKDPAKALLFSMKWL